MVEQIDQLNFALDGFLPWRPIQIRRTSLLSLLTICGTEEGRLLIREQGMANMIVDAILDLNFDDSVISIGAGALLYILADDVEDDTLLDSPACVNFLLKLLNPPIKVVEEKTMEIGSKLFKMRKPRTMKNENKGADSTSKALILKVKELLLSCNEIKSSSEDDDNVSKMPELSSKWIALIIMEKACSSSVSFEDTFEMPRNVWGNFKETFRELNGLDAIFDVLTDCHSTLEGWHKKQSASVLASKGGGSSSLESALHLLKSLKIMENATFMSEDNQNYLLKLTANLDSGGIPWSFVRTIISCMKFLSGLSLLQNISCTPDNVKSPSIIGAYTNGEIADLQDIPTNSNCGTKYSHLGKEEWPKRHKLSSSIMEASTSYNIAALHYSKGINCRNANGFKVRSHTKLNVSEESSQILCKRTQLCSNVKGRYAGDHSDPFAFDGDNLGPSKWELLSLNNGSADTRKQVNLEKEKLNGFENPLVVIDNRTSQPISDFNSSLFEDCLLTSVKVLMNLTNNNPVGCQQIGACGGLDILASLIASHFPSFDSRASIDIEIEEITASFDLNRSSGLDERKLNAHELDFMVAILGLLVNLVEKDNLNRLRLASARVLVNQLGSPASREVYRDVVPLLCSIFMLNQGTENASGEEEDEEAFLLQSQREAEMMIIEAYTALLLAFLSTESVAVKEAISRGLPNHRLEILVPVLERFVAFHMTFNMMSPETHSGVMKVIESCREP